MVKINLMAVCLLDSGGNNDDDSDLSDMESGDEEKTNKTTHQ